MEFSEKGLLIKIDKSASPLIYKLPQTEKIIQVEVEGKIVSGELKLKNNSQQGIKSDDDFIFRLGLVAEGSKKLNWLQRKASPAWIQRLHEIAPKDKGIDAIYFLEVAQDKSLISRKRSHPLSDLMKEEIVTSLELDGSFRFTKTLDAALPVAGLWISSDGDDSKSKYQVLITKINLYKQP
ncbi:hypothetical protein K2X05_13390 [bacterium]|nr:hypothetical protein [bacterium]